MIHCGAFSSELAILSKIAVPTAAAPDVARRFSIGMGFADGRWYWGFRPRIPIESLKPGVNNPGVHNARKSLGFAYGIL